MATPTPGSVPEAGTTAGTAGFAVPALVVTTLVAAASAAAALWIAEDRNGRTDCTWLAVSGAQFATSYVALLAAVAAVILAVRTLRSGGAGGRSAVAGVCLTVAAVVVLFGGFMVYATHMDAAEVAGRVGERFCL